MTKTEISVPQGHQIPGLDKRSLGDDSVGVLPCSSVSIIPPMLHIHFSFIYRQRHITLAIYTVVTKPLLSLFLPWIPVVYPTTMAALPRHVISWWKIFTSQVKSSNILSRIHNPDIISTGCLLYRSSEQGRFCHKARIRRDITRQLQCSGQLSFFPPY